MYVQYSNGGALLPSVNATLAPSSGKFSAGQPLNGPGSFTNQGGQTVQASVALLPAMGAYYPLTYPNNFLGAATGYTHDFVVRTLTSAAFSGQRARDARHQYHAAGNDYQPGRCQWFLCRRWRYATMPGTLILSATTSGRPIRDVMVQVFAPTATNVTFALSSDPGCAMTTANWQRQLRR